MNSGLRTQNVESSHLVTFTSVDGIWLCLIPPLKNFHIHVRQDNILLGVGSYSSWYMECISQFQLRPSPPPPPGYCRTFACLVSPGGGAVANFALPRGQAFANPGATPALLIRPWFSLVSLQLELTDA